MKAIEKVYQMSMYNFERAVYGAITSGGLFEHDPDFYVDNCYYFFLSDSDMAYGPKKGNIDLILEFSSKYPYMMTSELFFSCAAQLFYLIDLHGSDWIDVRNDYYIRWNSQFCEFGFLGDHWSLKYRG